MDFVNIILQVEHDTEYYGFYDRAFYNYAIRI